MSDPQPLWRSLGPGLVWAGTAVGVSHLVQSTRAGAGYGFSLLLIVLLANLLKEWWIHLLVAVNGSSKCVKWQCAVSRKCLP